MLVLSRKAGQTIVIGDGIEIQIAAVQGNRVRIAINAPRELRVLRGEIAESDAMAMRKPAETERQTPVAASNCI
jgi:carbon storage regulator